MTEAHEPRPPPRGHPSKAGSEPGGRLWAWPAVAAAAAFVSALLRIRPDGDHALAQAAWPGDHESASTMLQVVAGSVMTVTSLAFTLVVVALQLASQQYSPRLLREFTRDRVTQAVLAILVATFVFSVAVMRGLDAANPLPRPAVLVAFLLALASVAALLVFIGHIVRILRVDTMMVVVANEARRAMDNYYPPRGAVVDAEIEPPAGHEVHLLAAAESGFIRGTDVDALVRVAEGRGIFVVMTTRAGDHVVAGTPLGRIIHRPDLAAVDRVADDVRACLDLGHERNAQQDASFGFRQLTDIAVKALSPGINDPVTAAHALGHMSDLLVRLCGCRLGDTAHAGQDGIPRVVVPDRDLRYYLDLSCGQVRRYGSGEPTVLIAILRMLRDAATAAVDDSQRCEIGRQVTHVLEAMSPTLVEVDRASVEDMARRVHAAIDGDVEIAYGDRAGETRSI